MVNNTLLMSFSTFNGTKIGKWKVENSERKDDDKYVTYEYYYQMEPVIIMLSEKLKEMDQKIDNIVALVTKRAEEKKVLSFIDNETLIETGEYSPLTYLEKKYPHIKIHPVSIDIDDMTGGILDCSKILQEMNKETNNVKGNEESNTIDNGKDGFKLWIDNHGSIREISMIMQGIISLLDKEGIKPSQVFGCETDNENKIARVIQADEGFKISNFVSGMNEFLSSGKAKQLEIYFNVEDYSENRMIELINKISDSILLCDMNSFNNNIDELNDYFIDRDKTPNTVSNKRSYMDLFKEYITLDYGELLDRNKRTVVKEIEWCLKKDLIQQALTLIESHMPSVIVGSDCFNVNWTQNRQPKKKNTSNNWVNVGNPVNLEYVIGKCTPPWEQKENGILRKWAELEFNHVLNFDGAGNIIHMNLPGDLSTKNSSGYIWEQACTATTANYGYWQKYNESDSDKNYSFRVNISCSNSKKSIFEMFIKLHMSLRNQRNLANHSSNNGRVSIDVIKDAIEAYLQMAKCIF